MGAQVKLSKRGLIRTSHTVMGVLVIASCLVGPVAMAFGDEVTDPGIIVTEPGPADPQPDPVPAEPAPVDPAPVDPAPVPVNPVPAPLEPAPVPVQPAPVPAQPAPVPAPPVPAPVLPVPVAPAPVSAAPAPVRLVPRPVTSIPLRPSVPGTLATPPPAQEPTALAQAIDSIEALSDQPGGSALDNAEGAASPSATAHSSSRAAAPSAVASSPAFASKELSSIAETQVKAVVAVATGSPFVVQLVTVLALVAAGVAYFRFMGARNLRTPSGSRK